MTEETPVLKSPSVEMKWYFNAKEKRKEYYQQNKEKLDKRFKERYANDEEFRNKEKERRKQNYYKNKMQKKELKEVEEVVKSLEDVKKTPENTNNEIQQYLKIKEKQKLYYQENKTKINQRIKEKYANDENYREKHKQACMKYYYEKQHKKKETEVPNEV